MLSTSTRNMKYQEIHDKLARYSEIIKTEHRKAKSERRDDLPRIVEKANRLKRWLKELPK